MYAETMLDKHLDRQDEHERDTLSAEVNRLRQSLARMKMKLHNRQCAIDEAGDALQSGNVQTALDILEAYAAPLADYEDSAAIFWADRNEL